jgi:hypothetical protein
MVMTWRAARNCPDIIAFRDCLKMELQLQPTRETSPSQIPSASADGGSAFAYLARSGHTDAIGRDCLKTRESHPRQWVDVFRSNLHGLGE